MSLLRHHHSTVIYPSSVSKIDPRYFNRHEFSGVSASQCLSAPFNFRYSNMYVSSRLTSYAYSNTTYIHTYICMYVCCIRICIRRKTWRYIHIRIPKVKWGTEALRRWDARKLMTIKISRVNFWNWRRIDDSRVVMAQQRHASPLEGEETAPDGWILLVGLWPWEFA